MYQTDEVQNHVLRDSSAQITSSSSVTTSRTNTARPSEVGSPASALTPYQSTHCHYHSLMSMILWKQLNQGQRDKERDIQNSSLSLPLWLSLSLSLSYKALQHSRLVFWPDVPNILFCSVTVVTFSSKILQHCTQYDCNEWLDSHAVASYPKYDTDIILDAMKTFCLM